MRMGAGGFTGLSREGSRQVTTTQWTPKKAGDLKSLSHREATGINMSRSPKISWIRKILVHLDLLLKSSGPRTSTERIRNQNEVQGKYSLLLEQFQVISQRILIWYIRILQTHIDWYNRNVSIIAWEFYRFACSARYLTACSWNNRSETASLHGLETPPRFRPSTHQERKERTQEETRAFESIWLWAAIWFSSAW